MNAKKSRQSPTDHSEALLDEALAESFPASDPAALVGPGGGISGPEDVLQTGDAVLIVDVQRDFCAGGAMPIDDGDAVVPVLNRWIERASRLGLPIYASRVWHRRDHSDFGAQGGGRPAHCIEDSPGAEFHPGLKLPAETVIVSKDNGEQHSVFAKAALAEELRRRGLIRVFIGGLAEDFSVRATTIDAIRAGFKAHLIAGATRPVTAAGGKRALAEMRDAGVVVN